MLRLPRLQTCSGLSYVTGFCGFVWALLCLGTPLNSGAETLDKLIATALRTHISSDTLTEHSGSGQSISYYRAHVEVKPDPVKPNPKLTQVPLKPGMTASVDIRTNSRSELHYLVKPVFKAVSGALNER